MKTRAIARFGAFLRPPVGRHGALPAAFSMYGGSIVRTLYYAAGLYPPLFVTMYAFLGTVLLRPEQYGSQSGGYTADMLAIFAVSALVLTAAFFALALAPRAAAMLYGECMRRTFGFRRDDRTLLSEAWRETRGRYGAYLAAALFALPILAAGGALGHLLRAFPYGGAAGALLAWLLLSLLRLTLPAAIAEGETGFCAVRRSMELSCRRWMRVLPRRLLYELPPVAAQGAMLFLAVARYGRIAILPGLFVLTALQPLFWPYYAGLDTALYWIAVSDAAAEALQGAAEKEDGGTIGEAVCSAQEAPPRIAEGETTYENA